MRVHEVVCTAKQVVELSKRELDGQLDEHRVGVRAHYSLVSVGTEMATYRQTHIRFSSDDPEERPKLPARLGYCLSGEVTDVGPGVAEFSVGDRVLAIAPHASYVEVNTARRNAIKLPDSVSSRDAPFIRLGSISLVGVRRASIEFGDTVVVLGLGLIGHLAARIALMSGARAVYGFDLLESRVEAARRHGIGAERAPDDLRDRVASLTSGRMADVVIEATGSPSVIAESFDASRRGGRVVLLGSPRGRVEIDPYSQIHNRGVAVIGAHENTRPPCETQSEPWTRTADMQLLAELMGEGRFSIEGLVSEVADPRDVQQTYARLDARPEEYLGVLFDWRALSSENGL